MAIGCIFNEIIGRLRTPEILDSFKPIKTVSIKRIFISGDKTTTSFAVSNKCKTWSTYIDKSAILREFKFTGRK